MTATTLIATPDDGIPAEYVEAVLRLEKLFDATRPPCPSHWCNDECEINLHFGTSITHVSDETSVPCTSQSAVAGDDTRIDLWARRDDELDKPSESRVTLNFTNAELLDDNVDLTAAQCRKLAAALLHHADLIEPEHEVLATEVRVEDWLPVGDEWFQVYGVTIDEPTDSVQIYTTVDWDALPEFGGDEEPHVFDIKDMVRIRRATKAEVTK